MLPISLSSTSSAPYYQQIVDQVRNLVLSGRLPSGIPLPSIRTLAQQLTVSVITTRRAYEELEREGIIGTRPGAGSFVSELSANELSATRLTHLRSLLNEVLAEAKAVGVTPQQLQALLQEMLEQ